MHLPVPVQIDLSTAIWSIKCYLSNVLFNVILIGFVLCIVVVKAFADKPGGKSAQQFIVLNACIPTEVKGHVNVNLFVMSLCYYYM